MALFTLSCSPESVTGILFVTDSPVVEAAVMESNTTARLLDGVASRASKLGWSTDWWTTHASVEFWPGSTAVVDVHPVTVLPLLASVKLARPTVPVFRMDT
jgi:hypothetical protein